MKQVLTRLFDFKQNRFVEKWLTKNQFENLETERYCLPYEVENRKALLIEMGVLK
jgi:hypothetical protein